MIIETHCHTSRHSPCSIVDPVTLVHRLMEKGLDGIIITEHQYLWNESELEELRAEAGAPRSFTILSGQEVGTDFGHVLVYGAEKSIDEIMSLKSLRELVPQAALVWAHPFRYGNIPPEDKLMSPHLDAVEVLNGNQNEAENEMSIATWKRLGFNTISGSDTHAVNEAGIFPTVFTGDIEKMDDLVACIKEGQCRPMD